MMPVNDRWNVDELLATTRAYITKTNRRVSFEYVLLQGQNDTPELAAELADKLQGMLCHVNLIPWNPVPGCRSVARSDSGWWPSNGSSKTRMWPVPSASNAGCRSPQPADNSPGR
jgi:hypothetical protein